MSQPTYDSPMLDFRATCLDCRHPLHESMRDEFCPECGLAFDRRDPTTFNRVLQHPVMLMRGRIVEAGALRAALEGTGIGTALHEEVAGIIGHIDTQTASVWVDRDEEQLARQFMTTFQANQAQQDEATDTENQQNWTCANCNEHIEHQFAVCWSCGSERPD